MTEKLVLPISAQEDIFGSRDAYLRRLERELGVTVVLRDGFVSVSGEETGVRTALRIMEQLAGISMNGSDIDEQKIDYALEMKSEEREENVLERIDRTVICRTVSGRPVKPKTLGQEEYIEAIRNHMITFAGGPAGTGKTFLAMAMAITAFQAGEVQRIILTRPAIEAGEKLGFLPGDLQQKIDPYLRPLYDALFQIMGAENFQRNQEKGLIEVAPLAYMRGRTLDNAYVILDEAQNTTPEQMKMFLTRLGFGSKAIITGDPTQKDLSPSVPSGFEIAERVLKNVEGIRFCTLTARDVVRHPLVQKIVKAYEDYDSREVRSRQHEKARHEKACHEYGNRRRSAL
ncbi:PhoH family protein [Lachnoclostridium sp. Marseille-P6806]|uniref:PhoH family protein n=1 Tax=Lachnoclostridium sp. Marseille-P6806 TaxID=2364793 RepID=UPI00102F8E12|nr:PhoH family protein [Lachnoclostridium sp. Marseille-P6806]